MGSMMNEAPETTMAIDVKQFVDGNKDAVVFVLSAEEWEAHRQRVESLVTLVNRVVNGMAENPLFLAMLPPDVLETMRQQV